MTDEELQRVLKALADPNRRRILELLAEKEDQCSLTVPEGINCSMIVDQLSVSQPTVSHHMKELMQANLIQMTPSGSSSLLSVRRDTLSTTFELLRQRFHVS